MMYQPIIKQESVTTLLNPTRYKYNAVQQVRNYLKATSYKTDWMVTILCDGVDSNILTVANVGGGLYVLSDEPYIRKVIFQ